VTAFTLPDTYRPNLTRQRAIARLVARHTRIIAKDGTHLGCLCGHPGAFRTRNDYHLHIAELVDMLIQESLNSAFADHQRRPA
jgi:hypothetical protein